MKGKQVDRLVDRLNPTNRGSMERAKDDLIWNEIVEKVKKGIKINDVKKLKTAKDRDKPRSPASYSRQAQRTQAFTVSTMEGKRIKRKIITITKQKNIE